MPVSVAKGEIEESSESGEESEYAKLGEKLMSLARSVMPAHRHYNTVEEKLAETELEGITLRLYSLVPREDGGLEGVVCAVKNKGKLPAMPVSDQRISSEIHNWLTLCGPNINAKDHQGNTLMLVAAQSSYWDLVEWLVEHGGGVNARNNENRTVLYYAYKDKDWKQLTQWLIAHGAK